MTRFTSGDVRFPGHQRRRQDHRLRARLRHLEARPRQPAGQADPARDRRRNPGDPDRVQGVQLDRRRLRPRPRRQADRPRPCTASSSRPRPTKASSASSPKAPPATWMSSIPPTASRSPSSPTRAAARRSTSIAADGAGPARKVTDLDTLKTVVRLVARQQVDRFRDLRPQALHDRRRRQEPEGAGFLQLRRDRQSGLVAGRQADRLFQDRRLPFQRRLPDPQSRAARRRRSRSTRRARPIPASRPTAPRSTSSAARETSSGEARPSSQLFCVPLEKLTKDPDEPDQRPDGSAAEPGPETRRAIDGPGGHAQDARRSTGPGSKRRTRQVTRTGRSSATSRPTTARP